MIAKNPLRAAGLVPAGQTYYIDHLAPVCALFDAPLLFVEEADQQAAIEYYPHVKTQLSSFNELSPAFLGENFDVLFSSDPWKKNVFRKIFDPFNPNIRNVHCPHGYSDKAFHLKLTAEEDIALIYGQRMLDMLKEEGVIDLLDSYVLSGNLRYSYYQKNKVFFDELAEKHIFSKFKSNLPTILYAPTWMDAEQSGSFFIEAEELLSNLPSEYNLVVKLHPRLELDDPVRLYGIMGQFKAKSNILFIKDFPPIYPILDRCSFYLGDMSSIGYDFLAYTRPMFFLNPYGRDAATDPGLYLFKAGEEVTAESFYKKINTQIELEPIKKELYEYTFERVSEEKVRQEILNAL